MKKSSALLLLLICAAVCRSQSVNSERSFALAKKLSAERNKPLAIHITIKAIDITSNNPANGMKSQKVADFFNNNFVNYQTDRTDSAARKIIAEFKVRTFPVFIFLDSKGGLIFQQFNGYNEKRLLAMADLALYASKEKSLTDYDTEYRSGVYTAGFLKDYILKRRKAGINDNADLIEKYVNFLSVADLENYNEVLFILQAAPVVNSRAHKLAYINKAVIDSIYRTEPLALRQSINNGIINASMAKAVADKSLPMAMAVAQFTRDTWNNNFREGQKNYSLKLVQYYRAIKDTTNYLIQASYYYDQHYMNISADSMSRINDASRFKVRNAFLESTPGPAAPAVNYTLAEETFSAELNNAAYAFYLTGTQNTKYLNKALQWVQRSVDMWPNSYTYHTLSCVLYSLGRYAEAEAAQLKAIDLGKAEKRDTGPMLEEYKKMKKRELKPAANG